MTSMAKMLIVHHLPDCNDLPALERWFWKYHCPEVLQQAPWMSRYVMYRAVSAPPGAEAYGYYNYRVHENWVYSSQERRGSNGCLSMTPQPAPMQVIVAHIPAEPTDDFLGADMRYGEKTILRWVTVFRYPEEISPEEGDEWYLNVHVPQVMKQPGLIRFFSHKAIHSNQQRSPLPHSTKLKPFFTDSGPLFFKRWHRVSELWYEDSKGWFESIIKSPPCYTKPAWAKQEKYPFLVPGNEFISTFLLERPDQDMLRNYEPSYL